MSGGLFKGLARSAADRVRIHRDPVGFARSLGVNISGTVVFYTISRHMFGSEPWLVTLGDRVFITGDTQFITHDGGALVLRRDDPTVEWTAPIVVGNNVFIGSATILPGVTIGNDVVVGARSVLTHDVPNGSVVAGNPARIVSSIDDYRDRMTAKSLGLGTFQGDEKALAIADYYGIPRAKVPPLI